LEALSGYEGRHVPGVLAVVANLLAIPPLGPGPLMHPAAWSLSYEMLFYCLCALAWIGRRRIGCWSILVIGPIVAALLYYHVRAVLMPVGMLVAWLLYSQPRWARWALAPGLSLVAFLASWEYLCQANGADLMRITGLNLLQDGQPIAFVIAIAAASVMFAGVLGGKGMFCWLLGSPPLQFLGTVSYSLYLWHPIFMSMIKHAMYLMHLPARVGPLSQLLFFVLTLPCALVVAAISQKILEQRVTLWLRGILEPDRKRQHLVAPPQTHPTPAGESVS